MMRQRTAVPSAAERPTTEIRKKRVGCLVREEFSRKSLSYMATAIMAVFFGFAAIPIFSSAVIPLEESARSGGRLVDFFFLAIIAVLSINVFSRSYMLIHRDPFYGWLVFLRSLPVSPKETILARSLIMLPATLVMTTLFFAPITALSWTLDYQFDAGQYLWLSLVWLGYALFAGGMNLYLELGVKGKLVLILQFVWFASIVAAVWLMNGNLVFSTFELAGDYGPLAAGLALLVGGVFFDLLAKATEQRVAKREFVT